MILQRSRRTVLAGAFAGIAFVHALPASATSIALGEVSGRKGEAVRVHVQKSLAKAGHQVVVVSAAGELSPQQARLAATESESVAVLTGNILRLGPEDWQAIFALQSGRSGEVVGEPFTFEARWLPGLTRQLIDTLPKRMREALRAAEAVPVLPEVPEEVEPEPAPRVTGTAIARLSRSAMVPRRQKVVVEEDTGPEGQSSVPADGALFRLQARAGAVRRSLNFSDDIYERLRTHGVNMGVVQVEGIVYPFTRPVGERLGIIASYETGISGAVIDTDFNREFSAEFHEFFGGLRARYPVDAHEVGFDLTYGQMVAGLEDVGGQANVPDASYSVVRASLHGALNFGAVSSSVSAGFRLPLGYGEMSEDSWFPRVSGYGVEASAGVSYPITTRLVVELSGSLRRYVLEMNSEPEDAAGSGAEVAGGAIDSYVGGYLGVSYRL